MKRSFFTKSAALLGLLVFSIQAEATDANGPEWQIDVAPYGWAVSLNGTVQNGPVTAHIHESFTQLMKYFDSGGMLWLDAYKGRLGFFLNGLYVDLSDHEQIQHGQVQLNAHYGLISGGISYLLFQQDMALGRAQFEPYVGARYTLDRVILNPDFAPQFSSNQDWTDPFIGARIRDDWNTMWGLSLAADIGGRNSHTQYSTNIVGLIRCKPDFKSFNNMDLYLGYRSLHQHYAHGAGESAFLWNMDLFGPVAGLSFNVR